MKSVKTPQIIEYVWIDGKGGLRSKVRVLHDSPFEKIPEWNYDGSSTYQTSEDGNTEIILQPCAYYKNPFFDNNTTNILVLCDTYDISMNPLSSNSRYKAKKIFDQKFDEEPWFGLEQEYYIMGNCSPFDPNGKHYCGTQLNTIQRNITQEHLSACIKAGIKISGMNAEVAPNQWEFQVGPCNGISAGDDLYMARYLLERIAEKYNTTIFYHPKPFPTLSGSGCHINFSTASTRHDNGLHTIYEYIGRLEKNHTKHILNYGEDNQQRLTGKHETANYNVFSWGIGTRNTSIRIGNATCKDKKGYFEDRRPAANIDPYIATSLIFETCCLD